MLPEIPIQNENPNENIKTEPTPIVNDENINKPDSDAQIDLPEPEPEHPTTTTTSDSKHNNNDSDLNQIVINALDELLNQVVQDYESNLAKEKPNKLPVVVIKEEPSKTDTNNNNDSDKQEPVAASSSISTIDSIIDLVIKQTHINDLLLINKNMLDTAEKLGNSATHPPEDELKVGPKYSSWKPSTSIVVSQVEQPVDLSKQKINNIIPTTNLLASTTTTATATSATASAKVKKEKKPTNKKHKPPTLISSLLEQQDLIKKQQQQQLSSQKENVTARTLLTPAQYEQMWEEHCYTPNLPWLPKFREKLMQKPELLSKIDVKLDELNAVVSNKLPVVVVDEIKLDKSAKNANQVWIIFIFMRFSSLIRK